MDVVSLGCELGWVVVGWALGGVSFELVLLVSSLMMFSMWVSSSLVRVYRRYSRDIVRGNYWVCFSMGILPWYMAVRLIRSMCMPQLHPSCCHGVMTEMMWGLFVRSIGMLYGVF